jgi:hypothetical protein
VKNPQYSDRNGKEIGWLECKPEEWEETDDKEHCPNCDSYLNVTKGWDEDCNDYQVYWCGVCGWEQKE